MKIINLTARNVKRLTAVHISPEDGKPVIVGGKNGAGKSSVLDSIQYAIAGKRAICDSPVRSGQHEAEIILDLDDMTVTRIMTADGKGQLKVTSKEGVPFSSPQAMLDKLTGKLSFDPLGFLRQDSKKQLEQLKQVVGLDFGKLDGRRAQEYQSRAIANRDLVSLKNDLTHYPKQDNPPLEQISVSDLAHEYDCCVRNEAQRATLRQAFGVAKEGLRHSELQLEAAKQAFEQHTSFDTTAQVVKDQLTGAEIHNQNYRHEALRIELVAQIVQAERTADEHDDEIKAIDKKKKDALANAKFPVEGLSFTEDGLTFNGQPFEQASSAEQLKVAVSMGAALNSELRVILIRDGSLLDAESLAEVAKIAAANDVQLWIERVGSGKEVTVLIDDGAVVPKPAKTASLPFK